MSILLRISAPHQKHIGVTTIEIESSECTIAAIKDKISDKLHIGVDEITQIVIEANPTKIKEVTHLNDITLQDLGVTSGSCTLKINIKEKLEA